MDNSTFLFGGRSGTLRFRYVSLWAKCSINAFVTRELKGRKTGCLWITCYFKKLLRRNGCYVISSAQRTKNKALKGERALSVTL